MRRLLLAMLAATSAACGDEGPAGPPPPRDALRFDDITSGYYHSCAITPSGGVFCWGANEFGMLGDGTTASSALPARVLGGSFTAVDAGAAHTCALAGNGSVSCWGHNDEGQVGDGTFAPRDRPTAVSGSLRFTQVSAGHAHSCALTQDGAAWCWGDDSRGQLGDGADATKSNVPVRVAGTQRFRHVVAGYYASCGIDEDENAWCWGWNGEGQLGDGTTTQRDVPVRVQGGRRFGTIDVGDRFTCGVSGGAVWCWGANRQGELGDAAAASSVPVMIAGTSATSLITTSIGTSTIGSADAYACAIRAGGVGVCWGGAIRQLRARGPIAEELDARFHFDVLAAGALHLCALSRDGYAYCGGANSFGQLGDGTRVDRAELTAVRGAR